MSDVNPIRIPQMTRLEITSPPCIILDKVEYRFVLTEHILWKSMALQALF